MPLQDDEQFKVNFEEPFDLGYVIIPWKYIKASLMLTKKFAISPKSLKSDTVDKRNIKEVFLVVDGLNNKKIPVTLKSIAEALGQDIDFVRDALRKATNLDSLGKLTDGKYEIKLKDTRTISKSVKKAKKVKTKTTHIIARFKDKYKSKYGEQPHLDEKDRVEAKLLGEEFLEEKCFEFINLYIKSNDIFPPSHELKYLRRNIAKIQFKNNIEEEKRKKNKKSTDDGHAKDMDEWQLRDYLIGRVKGRWTGEESWAKHYERELKRRGITEKDLTEEDYKREAELSEE